MRGTEQVLTRDKARTRRAILEAAVQLLSERGSKASLTDIAKAAGVTQSGLRHHFPSRESLFHGVVENTIRDVWKEVHASIDLSENRPGKFMRGYIRALTGDSDKFTPVLDPTRLSAALGDLPGIETLYERDAEKWHAAFEADGLPKARVLVIQHAAEGLSIARSSPYLTREDLAMARAELLEMTEVG